MSESGREKAIRERERLVKRIAEIDNYLRLEAEFSARSKPKRRSGAIEQSPAERAALRRIRLNPSPRDIAGALEKIIESKGPMTRGPLVAALKEDGIELIGTDPTNTLGTMLWRLKDHFVNLPGHGYWLADRPYPAAGYDPATWEAEQRKAAEKFEK